MYIHTHTHTHTHILIRIHVYGNFLKLWSVRVEIFLCLLCYNSRHVIKHVTLKFFIMYLITSVISTAMLSSFSTAFLTMQKCNRVVFGNMRSGAVHHNGTQSCFARFLFSLHCFTASKNIFKKYVTKDILRNFHVKYGCGHSKTQPQKKN